MTKPFLVPLAPAGLVLFLALLSLSLVGASAASAATFIVDTSVDAVDATPGDGICATSAGVCTLRAAIQETNALPGEDAIEVPAGDYVLTIPGSGEDAASTGDLDITDDLILTGAGIDETIIDGDDLDRVFDVFALHLSSPPRVELAGVNVMGGVEDGGGILAEWVDLSILDSTVEENRGSGILAWYADLLVSGSIVEGNVSDWSGGGIWGENGNNITIQDCTIQHNEAAFLGGGISTEIDNTVTIEDSTIQRNDAGAHGGGVAKDVGPMTIRDSVIAENSAAGGGGGLAFHDEGHFLVERTTISSNRAETGAGGISVITASGLVSSSTIAGNQSDSGAGGIAVADLSQATIDNSTISGNAGLEGGGVQLGHVWPWDESWLRLSNSTIVDNSALRGGGIHVNHRRTSEFGVANSILAKNAASVGGPDCFVDPESGVPLSSGGHNILGDASECDFESSTGDQAGDATSPIDPRIGPLADNGGATRTHALLAGSPAIDAGSPDAPGSTEEACELLDQRGVLRPLDGDGDGVALCDIGAFERTRLVGIDIKPGSDPNSINPFSRGVIPVAILTTEDFDALTVDADSVLFGPAEAEKRHKRAHVEDVDDDGDADLLLHFRTQDTGIALGDTEACVIGQTYNDVPIIGCDSVRTVPKQHRFARGSRRR